MFDNKSEVFGVLTIQVLVHQPDSLGGSRQRRRTVERWYGTYADCQEHLSIWIRANPSIPVDYAKFQPDAEELRIPRVKAEEVTAILDGYEKIRKVINE